MISLSKIMKTNQGTEPLSNRDNGMNYNSKPTRYVWTHLDQPWSQHLGWSLDSEEKIGMIEFSRNLFVHIMAICFKIILKNNSRNAFIKLFIFKNKQL